MRPLPVEERRYTDRRQGRWVYYALNPETMTAMEDFVKGLRATSKLRVLAARCD